MTFQDIFKSGFLENVNAVPLLDMVLAMVLSFAVGLFIFLVYKRCYAGVMYSATFGVTLIGLTMVTALVILAVTSNIVLSLGMVGALSIVRFRTAIKEPSDIVFLFWAIAAGIVLAAGLLPLAIFGSLLIGLVLLVFSGQKSHEQPYILVLRCESSAESVCRALLEGKVKRLALKSKSLRGGQVELHYELRLEGGSTDFMEELTAMLGVSEAVLVSYNGDYMG